MAELKVIEFPRTIFEEGKVKVTTAVLTVDERNYPIISISSFRIAADKKFELNAFVLIVAPIALTILAVLAWDWHAVPKGYDVDEYVLLCVFGIPLIMIL